MYSDIKKRKQFLIICIIIKNVFILILYFSSKLIERNQYSLLRINNMYYDY